MRFDITTLIFVFKEMSDVYIFCKVDYLGGSSGHSPPNIFLATWILLTDSLRRGAFLFGNKLHHTSVAQCPEIKNKVCFLLGLFLFCSSLSI